jgi:hypothetical protein
MAATAYATRRLPLMREPRPLLRLVPAGPRSLAEVIDTAWAGIGAGMPVACPICDGRMEPHGSGRSGACRSCGSELS